nr:undecaprenyl diphosphate synthase family protein [Brachybacterium sillae]
MSGFLLWQSVHSELWFSDTHWPDFRREDLTAALEDFARRERRFGS